MSIELTIHPQNGNGEGLLSFDAKSYTATQTSLIFTSREHNDLAGNSPWTVEQAISLYGLSQADRDLLLAIGPLSQAERARLAATAKAMANGRKVMRDA